MERVEMRTRLLVLMSVFPLLVPVGCLAEAANPDSTRILVFSRTAGFRHASIEAGIEALSRIGTEDGFAVDATEDPSTFTVENLGRYSAVVFLSTTQDVLDEAQQQAFMRYIRAGGGFVGVHAAADTEHDWPWYGSLVGGYFASHPNNPNVRQGTILVVDPDHPSTAGLPSPWVRADEWYDFRNLAPDLRVLLHVDERSYKRAEENPAPEPRPIAWYHDYDGGRSWYTALGHTSESFSEPDFLTHLRGGLRYAIGAGAPVSIPRESPSQDPQRAAPRS